MNRQGAEVAKGVRWEELHTQKFGALYLALSAPWRFIPPKKISGRRGGTTSLAAGEFERAVTAFVEWNDEARGA
jgi:hypothetical protein